MAGLLNFLGFFFGWLACIGFGVSGYRYVGFFVALTLLVMHCLYAYKTHRRVYYQDFLLLCFALSIGFGWQMLVVGARLIEYPYATNLWTAPLWVLIIYPLFSATLNHSLSFFSRRPGWAFIIAIAASLIDYSFMNHWSLFRFPKPLGYAFPLLSLGSALLICRIIYYNRYLKRLIQATLSETNRLTTLYLLYDGDCPLCRREIAHLRKKNCIDHVVFVDISAPNYQPEKYGGIQYAEAMTQMHAVDAMGNIYRGIPAFVKLYAKTGYPFAAILMQLSPLKYIFFAMYRLFAANRLRITARSCKPKDQQ